MKSGAMIFAAAATALCSIPLAYPHEGSASPSVGKPPEQLGRVHFQTSCAPAIEKRFERLPWQHTIYLAESVSGDTAVGHALAYSHAIERLAGVEVPARAQALRVVLLELERLYNHIADIGALATDVAFTVPASRGAIRSIPS